MDVAIRCLISLFGAVFIASLAVTALLARRWRRLRFQLIDEVEQHLQDVAPAARRIDVVDRELAARPPAQLVDALLDERLSIQPSQA